MLPRKYRDAEVFGLVDTMGLLVAVVVVAANLSQLIMVLAPHPPTREVSPLWGVP